MDILSDRSMLIKVIDTLKKEQKKRISERNKNNLKQLFADDESNSREKIFLALSLIKLPQIPEDGKVSPMTIKSPIPHSFVDKYTNVLLLTRNIKKYGKDPEPMINEFKNKLKMHDALGLVSEVMPFSQLRSEYKDFENRRKLAHQYDIVLCDKEIISGVSSSLGKIFYKMKKKPLQVNLDSKDLKESIEKCLSRSILHLNLSGSCSTVQVGLMNQNSDDIADNILSTMTTWKKLMPGGWINIRSINLKTETSKSLPLFVSTTLPKDVPEVVNPYRLEDDVVAEDSLSTIEDKTVLVTRFGDVHVGSNLNEFKRKEKRRKARKIKYDPVTNNIVKCGEIVPGWQKDKQQVFKPRVEKQVRKLGGRYFQTGKKSSASKLKGLKKVGDNSSRKTSNKISKENQIHKSPIGEKTNLKRKRSVQSSTNTGSTEISIKRKRSAQLSVNTSSTETNLKRKQSAQRSTHAGSTETKRKRRRRSTKRSTNTGSTETTLKRKTSKPTTGAESTKKRRVINE